MSSDSAVNENSEKIEETKNQEIANPEEILEVKSLEEQVNKDEFVNKVMKQIRMFLALKYCKTDNIPAELIPGLFIGSIGAAMSKSKLQEIGITHILCVADSINPIFPNDFTYKVVKILDSPEVKIVDYLAECFEYISSGISRGKVLVHW
jgi:hypothetical protein